MERDGERLLMPDEIGGINAKVDSSPQKRGMDVST